MLKYLPYAIQVLALVAGATAGVVVKSAGGSGASHEEAQASEDILEKAGDGEEAKAAHEKEPKKEAYASKEKPKKKKKSGSHGEGEEKAKEKSGGHGEKDAASDGYMRFGRQFIVPVISKDGVKSLVVMDINLEVPPAATETIYQSEPKLRDALLSTLLRLSNEGAFSGVVFNESNLDDIRADLLEAAHSVIGDDALGVLILSFTRQDV